jgi:hypothetical protein
MTSSKRFFLLWMVLASVWVIGNAWKLRYELVAHCEQIAERSLYTAVHCLFERADQGWRGLPAGIAHSDPDNCFQAAYIAAHRSIHCRPVILGS